MTKNILLLNNAYWPSIGGVENSLRHLALESIRSGYKVNVVVGDIGLPQYSKSRMSEIIDNIQVTRYPIAPIKFGFLKWLNIFVSSWYLYKILKVEYESFPNTIVISRFHICAVIAVFIGFKNVRYLIPSVITNQSSIELTLRGNIFIRMREKLFIKWHSYWQRLAIRISRNFVFSKTMYLQCKKLSGSQKIDFIIVKPGVDKKRFNPSSQDVRIALRKKIGLPLDKTLILFVGRFVKAKGCDLLIKSMALMPNSFHLVMVGDGVEKNTYHELIKSNLIKDKVTIVKPTRNVEEYYQSSDIFVMCSRYEPLGQTILEAFSCGLPVVAFTPGAEVDTAIKELEMDQYVWYSNELSKEALADTIKLCSVHLNQLDRYLISKSVNIKFSWFALLDSLTK
jgi:glycosyltransferase involved in cell wall biosynthesis